MKLINPNFSDEFDFNRGTMKALVNDVIAALPDEETVDFETIRNIAATVGGNKYNAVIARMTDGHLHGLLTAAGYKVII